jgi:tetratricopeptide (TPR) repeat protein
LCGSGQFEEAVSIFLDLGELDEAAIAAEKAVPHLVERADWVVLLRWLDALGEERIEAHPLLQGARIRSLSGRRRLPQVQELIRNLHRSGELQKIVSADPSVMPYVGQALQWRSAEALELLDNYPVDHYSDAIRFELLAIGSRTPTVAPRALRFTDIMERQVSWGLLVQGRLDDLLVMLPDGADWPPSNYFRSPHPLPALIWRGELARARELLDQVHQTVRDGWHSDFWFFHEAWLLWAEGRYEEALAAATSAVEHSSRTGFGWEPCFDMVVGFMLVVLGRHKDARTVLSGAIRQSMSSQKRAYAEWGLTFSGLSFLIEEKYDDAARTLRRAVDGMRRARRTLMWPLAGIFLAKAEAELGNTEDAVTVANEAYDVAAEMGALFILRRALEFAPSVVEHQITHDRQSDRWRRIEGFGRPASPTGTVAVRAGGGRQILIQPFGDSPDLCLDGRPACIRPGSTESSCRPSSSPTPTSATEATTSARWCTGCASAPRSASVAARAAWCSGRRARPSTAATCASSGWWPRPPT